MRFLLMSKPTTMARIVTINLMTTPIKRKEIVDRKQKMGDAKHHEDESDDIAKKKEDNAT